MSSQNKKLKEFVMTMDDFRIKFILGRCRKVEEREYEIMMQKLISIIKDSSTIEDATNKHFDSSLGNPKQQLDSLINNLNDKITKEAI